MGSTTCRRQKLYVSVVFSLHNFVLIPGLARAIESKYNVSATAIRYLYRRNRKGITAKLDDDLLKYYCNEDTFLMQVPGN